MRKIFILVIVLFAWILPSFSEVYEAKYCAAVKEEKTGSTFSKVVSAVTGSTFASSKAA